MQMWKLKKSSFFAIFVIFYVFYNPAHGKGAVSLTSENIDDVLASNELALVLFHLDTCRHSNVFVPVFDEAADKIREAFPDDGKVVLGIVDCGKEILLNKRFQIGKYPYVKIVRNGELSKREYLGQRSVNALFEFVKKQMEDPIREFKSLQDLEHLNSKNRSFIGYFEDRDQPEYDTFRRVASILGDDCQFHVGFGDAAQAMHPPGHPMIVFRPDVAVSYENDETYTGSLNDFDELKVWMQGKCAPLVSEITFQNAEELHEDGLPFLIQFHSPDDASTVKKFKVFIKEKLVDEKPFINFLTDDGRRFSYPVHNMGKTESDLPLIGLDTFLYMNMYPDKELDELHGWDRQSCGKPEPLNKNHDSWPPVSTFEKWGPSILKKDEL